MFQDGSTHRWIGALGHDLDLIVTMNDATNWIYSAILVDEEGTMSSFLGLRETIAAHGLFGSLYTDRGSHCFFTPKAGGKVDKEHLTQVGRALAQLGIRHIPSYSPEARGRMERVFGTLQQRLPPELRRAGVRTMEVANAGASLDDVLWSLQIPAQQHRHHYVKATVRVHEYPHGQLAVFDGPRCLARYDTNGTLLDDPLSRALHRLVRPASPRLASCSPPSSTLRAACGGGLRPSLTAAARDAHIASGRGGKTPLQPNRKTLIGRAVRRTTHALHNPDIFTRYRQRTLLRRRFGLAIVISKRAIWPSLSCATWTKR